MPKLTDIEKDLLRERNPISQVIGPYVTWDRKKTKASKGDYWACCPFHSETTPSFHCEDSKGRYYCFGCGASGDQFQFLTDYCGMSFPDAVRALGGEIQSQISPERLAEIEERQKREKEELRKQQQMSAEMRTRQARALFKTASPLAGTIAEQYLLGRAIPSQEWDGDRLRFHPNLELMIPPHGSHPALVASVTNAADEMVSMWQIYLNPDGTPLQHGGKKIKVGRGPSSGGSCRLYPKSNTICLAEGIETALAVRQIIGGAYPVWSCLSAPGLQSWAPPDDVKEVWIYADGDSSRIHPNTGKFSRGTGQTVSQELARRLEHAGIKTTVKVPPMGSDWLDVWQTALKADQYAE